MPNSFNLANYSFPLVDPRKIITNRTRFLRDEIPELSLANSVYISGGETPLRGWILLNKNAFNTIVNQGIYSSTFNLQLDECVPKGNKIQLNNLSIVQARSMTTGLSGDRNAIYLVELTDGRGICANRWFQFPLNAYYNCRAPAYPGIYYADSLNSGSAWTWATMIGNIWSKMASFLGSFPGLPVTPTGIPEGFFFPGVPAWAALNRILRLLGMEIAVSPTGAFSIVQKGAADAAFTALQASSIGRLQDDLAYIDAGSGRVPGTVIVCFHRRNQYYGTEETITSTAGLQWATNAVYTVSIAAPATFNGATGTHYIWDDFQPQYDVNGVILSADATTAATIAAERVTQYYQNVYSGTLGYMRQAYAGLIPFGTGSQVDGICFRMTGNKRLSWQTEIVRGRTPLWSEVEKFSQVIGGYQ